MLPSTVFVETNLQRPAGVEIKRDGVRDLYLIVSFFLCRRRGTVQRERSDEGENETPAFSDGAAARQKESEEAGKNGALYVPMGGRDTGPGPESRPKHADRDHHEHGGASERTGTATMQSRAGCSLNVPSISWAQMGDVVTA